MFFADGLHPEAVCCVCVNSGSGFSLAKSYHIVEVASITIWKYTITKTTFLGGLPVKNNGIITEKGQELKKHGSAAFPCAAYESRGEAMGFPWHWHEEFELSVVEEGFVEFYTGQECCRLGAGDAILINSGTLHSVPSPILGESRKKDIVFSGKLIYGSFDSIFWEKYFQPIISSQRLPAYVFHGDVTWEARVAGQALLAHKALLGQAYEREIFVKKVLTDIFYELILHCRDAVDENAKNIRDNERIKKMLGFIHEHYRENITVAMIADHANVCTRECLRCFREFIHMSPIQYVISCRLNDACRMLGSGEYTVTEVCEACGFENPSYFSKMFRRQTGLTPSAYRRKKA